MINPWAIDEMIHAAIPRVCLCQLRERMAMGLCQNGGIPEIPEIAILIWAMIYTSWELRGFLILRQRHATACNGI